MIPTYRSFVHAGRCLVLLLHLLLAGAGIPTASSQEPIPEAYTNLLDARWKVKDTLRINTVLFSDAGAWHAYTLPADGKDQGGFTGPLVMDMQGEWLSNCLAKLELEEGKKILQPDTLRTKLFYKPGMLEQVLYYPGWEASLQLVFVKDRQSLLYVQVKNTAATARSLRLRWSGELLKKACRLRAEESSLKVNFNGSAKQLRIDLPQEEAWKVGVTGDAYTATGKAVRVQPGSSIHTWQQQSFFPDSSNAAGYPKKADPDPALQQTAKRWTGYLSNYFRSTNNRTLSLPEQKLAVKCIMTLMNNWRSPSRDLRHHSIFPSISYKGFYGAWSWDSWKHAAALAFIDTAQATENLRCLFDYQDTSGMIPDCIYADKSENNWRNTKAPLAAWAVWEIYGQTKDKNLLREFYPKLLSYHQWWYRYRDHDQNGLCEFGSTDGTRLAAAWESGMDNAVRFDNAKMLQNAATAWSLNQESVDLNSFLYREKIYLASIAEELENTEAATTWRQAAADLKEKINNSFFGAAPAYYYDRRLVSGELISIPGPEGWLPLWAGIAAPQQAGAVRQLLMDEQYFFTPLPLPTLNRKHPAFDPLKGYWRGPVWLDQVYFAVTGLKQYGYQSEAATLQQKVFREARGLLDNAPVYENYHPLTGKGLNAANFSWSAAMILLLIKES